jgi:hypothetical protein
MYVEIGTEATQFPEKEFINVISLQYRIDRICYQLCHHSIPGGVGAL